MPPIIVTSQEELSLTISEAVESAVKRILPEAVRRATTKPYLTRKELMKLTGWSARQVAYKQSRGELPFIKRGRLVLFPTRDVFAYLDEGFISARKRDQ